MALQGAMAGASVRALRGHAAVPSYAWKASAAIAAVAAASLALALVDARLLVLGRLATSVWMFSATFFAWQAARMGVRLGGRPAWASR